MSNWAKLLKTGAFGLLLAAGNAVATPWIETNNLQARHHLEALSAMGCFDEGLTLSWPVNWSAVANGLAADQHAGRGRVRGGQHHRDLHLEVRG